ncbi:terpenoid synthase [Glonium stellatum]|uniref:geranylgeranyl diphosphate synthase n=1 Tax=Glonium stellatum TaxID=574774 RepID=A0A8E2JQ72_9PEZI|nr:terpenoid synthase [Glonium stellatum]
MVPDSLKSPNAIPPRTSSHGIVTNGQHVSSVKSVLRPLSENDWIAQGKKHTPSISHTHLQPASMATPQPDTLKGIGDDLIHQNHAMWSEEKEKILLGPYEYLYGHPGKDMRSQLIAAFNKWLNVPAGSLEIITKVVGMLHTASLLVDDVEDSSVLRRGVPVANSIFGTAQVINSANYVYFLALRELSKLSNPKMIEIFTEELLNLHRGQGMDLYWRDSLTCPSEADYLEMVGNKTGGLFRLAIKLMQAGSSINIDCVPLVNTIGLLFQILDDHLNLSPTYTAAKGLYEDLTEGKFSFPIIYAIRSDPSNLVLINILKQKTMDEEVKRYAVSYMERAGSFEYSRKCIDELRDKAGKMVDELESSLGEQGKEGGEAMRKVLDKLAVR